MNEKELIENRNEKVTKMEEIVNLAKEEKRVLSNEELETFNNLKEEVKSIDNTLAVEKEMSNMNLEKVEDVKGLTNEEKDYKEMANIIRTINNDATQLTKGDNGVVIPSTIAKKIMDKVAEISPLYASATKYKAKGTLIIPKVDDSADDVTVDYATEFSDLVSHSNKFGSITLTGFLVGALTKISKSLLNNSDVKLVDFVIDRMAGFFARFYEKEGLNGTANKISGIAGSYDATNMKVQLAKKSSITSDELIDIQEKVPDLYQADAYWIMNRATRKAIRKLKDGQNNYLLNQVFDKAWDYELLGKPVKCSENATALGTASKPVIFYGDFSGLAVKEAEEIEISVLKELYATQHAIGVCGYAELDAKVENVQKIAVAVSGSAD